MKTPEDLLNDITKTYPTIWKTVENAYFAKGNDLPDWESWCFLPMAGWYAILCGVLGVQRIQQTLINDVARLSAVGTWRYSRGGYRFDKDLFEQITSTPIKGEIPFDVLKRLPQWCVYIEADVFDGSKGFFAHLEHDANEGHPELRLLVNYGDMPTMPLVLHVGGLSIAEAMEATRREAERTMGLKINAYVSDDITDSMSKAVNLLLYICSDAPDMPMGLNPSNAGVKKTKKGPRLFPAEKTRIFVVGEKIGRKIREARAGHHYSAWIKKAPHIRSAHWHGYWTGKGRTNYKLNWIAPVFVGDCETDE